MSGSQPTAGARLWSGRIPALLGILLVSLSLRTAVVAISPIIGSIQEDLPLDGVALGVIGMAPPVAFAVAGILAPMLERRAGLTVAMAVGVLLMAAGHVARAVAPSPGFLVAASAVALAGVGLANVLLPGAVKRYFPDRIGALTAAYAAIQSIGAATAAFIAVPVAEAAGWRMSLLLWFVVAVTALAPWVLLALRQHRETRLRVRAARESDLPAPVPARPVTGIWRSPTAVAIAIAFVVSATTGYAMFMWLPAILIEMAGMAPVTAGIWLGVYTGVGLPLAVIVPPLVARVRNVRVLMYPAIAMMLAFPLGMLIAPEAGAALWVVLGGVGAAVLFPIVLVLFGLRTRTHSGSVALSGFVQSIGYGCGAIGPLAFGLLYEATGGWHAALWFLLAVTALAIIPAAMLLRPRFIEDELAAKHRDHGSTRRSTPLESPLSA
jgi:MFS transporter, CP family, cyanate transporter